MANTKSKSVIVDAILYYPKVFLENRDMGNEHVDLSETDGMYKVDLLLDDANVKKLEEAGMPKKFGAFPAFKPAEHEGQSYKKYTAKRPHLSKYLTDEAGDRRVMGPPVVFDFNAYQEAYKAAGGQGKADEHIVPLTIQDGLIGNGTKAKVRLNIYKGMKATIVTLERIGITDLVVYETAGNSEWF
jgi:hypothetical protein